MADIAHSFDDSAAYERFMGRWSRAAGEVFVDWLAPPVGVRWLDVGCGTGVFTELILDTCSPSAVFGVDPAQAQIDYARRRLISQEVALQVADARALPFPDASFDIVASALVINFISDRPRALSEMRRVLRAGGLVAGFVWDFDAELSPSWPLRHAMRQAGADVPPAPGTKESSLDALHALFKQAGFEGIAKNSITVTVRFPNFYAFWQAQTPHYTPIGKMIAEMTTADRVRVMEAVRAELTVCTDGTIRYSARANAIKAHLPNFRAER